MDLTKLRAAQTIWAARPLKERGEVLCQFKRRVYERAQEAAELINSESGKLIAEAKLMDVYPTLGLVDSLIANAGALKRQKVKLPGIAFAGRSSTVQSVPVGVVGVISPWNYPLQIPAAGVLTALLAGNAVVLKPSEKTPKIGAWLVDQLHALGAPVECVQGAGAEGAALVETADAILFTGSVATGTAIGRRCGERLIPCLLELGGKDPLIALPYADVAKVVRGAVWGAFANAGQSCASVERMLVPKEELGLYEKEIIRQVSLLKKGEDWGPMIDEIGMQRALEHSKQGRLLIGGAVEGLWMEPTAIVLDNATSSAWNEETFGPLLPILAYDNVESAIALANTNSFGLTASIWGPGAEKLAPRLEAGTVTINDCVYTAGAPDTPWTGWKQSGLGVSHGAWGFQAVTKLQHINTQKAQHSPWQYPYEGLDEFMAAGMAGFLSLIHI